MGDAGKNGGVGHLEAVQSEDGQHGSVGDGVEEFVGVPGGGQRRGLRLAVAHHAGGDEAGVVHDGAEGVGQGVAQFPALIDGAGGLRPSVAGDAAREGELAEQPLHAGGVLADVGVYLAVRAVQIVLGHDGVAAVAGAADVYHVQVIFDDGPVQVGVDKVLARAGAPVAHDFLLDVFRLQGFLQQRVVQQIELAGSEVVGGTPVSVDLLQLGGGQSSFPAHAGSGLGDGFGDAFGSLGFSRHSKNLLFQNKSLFQLAPSKAERAEGHNPHLYYIQFQERINNNLR